MIDGYTTVSLTLVIGLLGAFIVFGRWQGRVDTKLDNLADMIKNDRDALKLDLNNLFNKVREVDNRVGTLETRVTIVETQHKHNHRPRKKIDTE
jgi:hypothetical protein